MSESPTSPDELVEQQMRTIEQGQQTLTQSSMIPFRQTMEIQRHLGEVFLSGLELNESLQRMSVNMTRSAFRNYLNTFEGIVTDMTREQQQMTQGLRQGTSGTAGGQQPPTQQPPQQIPPQQGPPQQSPTQQPPQQGPPQQSPTQQPPQQAPPQQPPAQQAPPQQGQAELQYGQQQPETEYGQQQPETEYGQQQPETEYGQSPPAEQPQ